MPLSDTTARARLAALTALTLTAAAGALLVEVAPGPVAATSSATPPEESPPGTPGPEVPPSRPRHHVSPPTTSLMIVGGEAPRCRPAADGTPTCGPGNLERAPVPTTVAPALCHAEHPNAVAVSNAIRGHFPAGWWLAFCRIAWCESTFNPGARNRSGATGLFQIMPMWHDEVPGADPWTIGGSAALARYVFDAQGPDAWSCW